MRINKSGEIFYAAVANQHVSRRIYADIINSLQANNEIHEVDFIARYLFSWLYLQAWSRMLDKINYCLDKDQALLRECIELYQQGLGHQATDDFDLMQTNLMEESYTTTIQPFIRYLVQNYDRFNLHVKPSIAIDFAKPIHNCMENFSDQATVAGKVNLADITSAWLRSKPYHDCVSDIVLSVDIHKELQKNHLKINCFNLSEYQKPITVSDLLILLQHRWQAFSLLLYVQSLYEEGISSLYYMQYQRRLNTVYAFFEDVINNPLKAKYAGEDERFFGEENPLGRLSQKDDIFAFGNPQANNDRVQSLPLGKRMEFSFKQFGKTTAKKEFTEEHLFSEFHSEDETVVARELTKFWFDKKHLQLLDILLIEKVTGKHYTDEQISDTLQEDKLFHRNDTKAGDGIRRGFYNRLKIRFTQNYLSQLGAYFNRDEVTLS